VCIKRERERRGLVHVALLAKGIGIGVGNVAVEVALGDLDLRFKSVPQPIEERLRIGQDRCESSVDVVDTIVQALLFAKVLRLELTGGGGDGGCECASACGNTRRGWFEPEVVVREAGVEGGDEGNERPPRGTQGERTERRRGKSLLRIGRLGELLVLLVQLLVELFV
jgi:hypothetical protein